MKMNCALRFCVPVLVEDEIEVEVMIDREL